MAQKRQRLSYTETLEEMVLHLIEQRRQAANATPGPERKGVVYVINQVGTDHYKIGISTNYDERLKLFTVKLPFDIREQAVYETDDYIEKERELHTLFADKRLNGSEFFKLTAEDLDEIPKVIYGEQPEPDTDEDGDADLIEQAKAIVQAEGKASTSLLQRRLRVGYARAARIIDFLENEGFIGKANGSLGRELKDPTA